jgi:branched-chain amino acid transport system substrate-binding protein
MLAAGLAGGVGAGAGLLPAMPAVAQSKGKLRVGAALGLTGIFAGDGEEFRRGLIMAIEEINAAGGLGGYELEPVVVDAEDTFVEQTKAAFERLVRNEQVDVVFAGFLLGTGVELDIVAEAGIPYVSQQAKQAVTDAIKNNREKYRMVFQTCPTGPWYGYGFADFLRSVPESLLPKGKTVAVIGGDNAYSSPIVAAMRPALTELGWTETYHEVIPMGIPDWTPTLSKLRENPPSVIAICDGLVGDDALFIKQFADLPTDSLIYMVYTPSTPEFLDVVGQKAEGVVWSSVIGILPDAIGDAFRESYGKRWNGDEPSFAAAGPMYDQVQMWAQAVRLAGDPKNYEAVSKAFPGVIYRGCCGSYRVRNDDLTVPSYPTQEPDPTLGLPHMFYQIEGGKHRSVWPQPYAQVTLAKASWMK